MPKAYMNSNKTLNIITSNRIEQAIIDAASIQGKPVEDIEEAIRERCCLSKNSLTYLKTNKSQPSWRNAWIIADVLQVHVDDLYKIQVV